MGFKTKEIIDLIERQPGIRLAEIADELDLDEELVMPSIQGEVTSGAIFATSVKSIGGRDTWSFRIATDSERIAALPAWIAPVKVNHHEQPTRKPYSPRACAGLTKPQKAINFIRTNGGKATSAELRDAMGLKAEQVPIQFLKAALNDGRLKREGVLWVLGDASKDNVEGNSAAKEGQRRNLSEEDVTRIADRLLGAMLQRLRIS